MSNSAIKDSLIVCQNSHGVELRATLLRLTRCVAVFEIYSLGSLLRTSEVLTDFRIVISSRTAYSGRAVVSNIVHSGSVTMCEVKLDEGSLNVVSFAPLNGQLATADGFNMLLADWQKFYHHTHHVLKRLLKKFRRWTQITIQIKSVHHVLNKSAKPGGEKYKYIYRAWLFDYLSDHVCKKLMNIFYSSLIPGGLLVATNGEACKPFRHMLERLVKQLWKHTR